MKFEYQVSQNKIMTLKTYSKELTEFLVGIHIFLTKNVGSNFKPRLITATDEAYQCLRRG